MNKETVLKCWLITRYACVIHHYSDLHILLSQNSQQIGAVNADRSSMASAKYEVEKFTGQNDFGLWRLKMKALLMHQGLEDALNGETNLDVKMEGKDKKI